MRVENKRTYKGEGVYVGRPSKWGNPYTHVTGGDTLASYLVENRDSAVAAYERYAREQLRRDPTWLDDLRDAEVLICWCAPLLCHGDVLVRLIQETS